MVLKKKKKNGDFSVIEENFHEKYRMKMSVIIKCHSLYEMTLQFSKSWFCSLHCRIAVFFKHFIIFIIMITILIKTLIHNFLSTYFLRFWIQRLMVDWKKVSLKRLFIFIHTFISVTYQKYAGFNTERILLVERAGMG